MYAISFPLSLSCKKIRALTYVQLRKLDHSLGISQIPSNIRRQIEGQKLKHCNEESHLHLFSEDHLRFFDDRTTQVQGQRKAK